MAVPTLDPALLAFRLDPPSLMRALGMEPDPWQRDLLLSKAGRILVLSTRQAGKSTTCAVLGLLNALTVPRSLILLVSASHDQSKELFLKLTERYDQLGRPIRSTKQNTTELRLVNGSRVLSVPSSPDTVRGYSKANIIICDEAAVMEDAMFVSVSPMRAVSGGRLILISTPQGNRGYFWDQWENGKDWERYRIEASQCPRITPEFLESERAHMGESEYLQEYFCQFTQANDQYFRSEDIDRAFESEEPALFRGPILAEEPHA